MQKTMCTLMHNHSHTYQHVYTCMIIGLYALIISIKLIMVVYICVIYIRDTNSHASASYLVWFCLVKYFTLSALPQAI